MNLYKIIVLVMLITTVLIQIKTFQTMEKMVLDRNDAYERAIYSQTGK